ncbi:MAG: CapA family protein [Clostridia bacterium]|nr:CapA family protein [Clostridia bacterium]
MKTRTKRQKAIIKRRIFLGACAIILVSAIAVICLAVSAIVKTVKPERIKTSPKEKQSKTVDSSSDKGTETVTATVINTGDIILHDRIFKDALLPDGSFDFSDFFKVTGDRFKSADYAVANLEVTLGGSEAGAYSGFPAFNSPDTLLDPIKNAGIDLLLTANNHSYDTGFSGLKRTVSRVKEYGFDFIGTKESENDPTYIIKDINGIKIGITCFTYETKSAPDGRKTLNGNVLASDAQDFINSFDYDEIEKFYKAAKSIVKNMKADKADAIVFYMHWGEEYKRSPNTWQKSIAQKLCNMGVDVIVGGHPHVLQPVSLLHSENSKKTTVCAYSLGNAISNQRRELLKTLCPTGHSEDGALFTYTFTKTDGKTKLTAVDLVPTYLDKFTKNGKYRYTMYPIDNAAAADSYGLGTTTVAKLKESFARTKEVVGEGLTECQNSLGCKIRFKD